MSDPSHTISNPHAAALEERAMGHFGDNMAALTAAVEALTLRIAALEGIERRLNYPVIGLLASILCVLVYTAHRLP